MAAIYGSPPAVIIALLISFATVIGLIASNVIRLSVKLYVLLWYIEYIFVDVGVVKTAIIQSDFCGFPARYDKNPLFVVSVVSVKDNELRTPTIFIGLVCLTSNPNGNTAVFVITVVLIEGFVGGT